MMILKQKQTGFTLVEIAIVLVIIGLLLGGILKGQELINSARVRALADQNSGIQAAYFGFIDRYRKVPGDMLAADACDALGADNFSDPAYCTTVVGNNNGRIDTDEEALSTWAQLSAGNFITGVYPGLGTYDNTTAPVNPFQGAVKLIYSTDYNSGDGTAATSARLSYFFGTQIPVNVAREIDVKLDNGIPGSGIVRSSTNTTVGDPEFSSAGCIDEGIWNINENDPDCNAVYIY
ncbi:MAG: prepilin-type N-terminal cleavage/methylation domain-containing protein [Gammaproteobacteria bacterium]